MKLRAIVERVLAKGCPFCGSSNIELIESHSPNTGGLFKCKSCGDEWHEY